MKKFEYLLLNTESGFFKGFDYKQLTERLLLRSRLCSPLVDLTP